MGTSLSYRGNRLHNGVLKERSARRRKSAAIGWVKNRGNGIGGTPNSLEGERLVFE